MTHEPVIAAWRDFGVLIEQDGAGFWSWAETSEADANEPTGAFSPAFSTVEACVADLVECFGPLPTAALRPVDAGGEG